MANFSCIENLQAWLEEAYSRETTGSYDDCKLGPVSDILKACNLHLLRPITFAGTKGKGSTLVMTEAILLAHGCNTVAFTSPHVFELSERWRINGDNVGFPILAKAASRLAAAEEQRQIALTYFERCFVIACLLAAEQGSQGKSVFLCEVGLGGRLDCANALDTQLAILTHLSYDHCQVLGYTLTEIATEKLAIARADSPLLIAPQSSAADAAIRQVLPPAASITFLERADIHDLALPGAHQLDNASTALAVAERLLPDTYNPALAQRALQQAQLPGRCQMLTHHGRQVMVDGAHNPASLAATLACADEQLHADWQLVLAVANDKDIHAMVSLIPDKLRVVRCAYQHPRSRQQADWPDHCQAWPWFDSLITALDACDPDKDLCISGSLYLAGEALLFFAGKDVE